MTRLLAFPICLILLITFGCGDEGEMVSPTAESEAVFPVAAAPEATDETSTGTIISVDPGGQTGKLRQHDTGRVLPFVFNRCGEFENVVGGCGADVFVEVGDEVILITVATPDTAGKFIARVVIPGNHQ